MHTHGYSGNPAMLFAYTVWQRQLPYCIYSGNEWHGYGLPYLRVTRQSTRRRRVSNLSKGKKEGKEKEGRKGKKIIKIRYK